MSQEKLKNNSQMDINPPISFQEGPLIVKEIRNWEEKLCVYRLRHKVFCEELKWVPCTKDKLEIDEYDQKSVLFGVFDTTTLKPNKKLLACLRLILPESDFMLEREFSCLIEPGYHIRKENDTVEISRLSVAPEARGKILSHNFNFYYVSFLLYKGIYLWSIIHNIKYFYIVVELKFYRLLRIMGFSCRAIGKPEVMEDRVIAIAAILSRRDFEVLNESRNPAMIRWFSQYQSNPAQEQWQHTEPYLLHQAFA
ncbi:MAG: acyl-homoserine-lactone synthase [bacterium]